MNSPFRSLFAVTIVLFLSLVPSAKSLPVLTGISWHPFNGSYRLYTIDPSDGTLLKTVPTSVEIGELTSGNGFLWVISVAPVNGRFQIYRISPNSGSVLQTLTSNLDATYPSVGVGGLAYGNGSLWAMSRGTSIGVEADQYIYEINPANGNLIRTISTSVPGFGLANIAGLT